MIFEQLEGAEGGSSSYSFMAEGRFMRLEVIVLSSLVRALTVI